MHMEELEPETRECELDRLSLPTVSTCSSQFAGLPSPPGKPPSTMAIRRIPPALVFAVVLGLILSAAYEYSDVDPHANGPSALRALLTGGFAPEVEQGLIIAGVTRDQYLSPVAPT
jgi:hypothetical protein